MNTALAVIVPVRVFHTRSFVVENVIFISDGKTTFIEYRKETVVVVREIK